MAASEGVLVVQETPTGMWTAFCIDLRCEDVACSGGSHDLARSKHRATADAAAARHRKLLRTLPVYEETRRTDICRHCGQSERANAELRALVADLENRLARSGAEVA